MLKRDGRQLGLVLLILMVGYGAGLFSGNLWQDGGTAAHAGRRVRGGQEQGIAIVPKDGGALSPGQEKATSHLTRNSGSTRRVGILGSTRSSLFRQARAYSLLPNPEMIRAAVEQLHDDELLDLVQTYTGLIPQDLPEDVPVVDFAERLGEIYYSDSFERAGNQLDDPILASHVEFDIHCDEDNRTVEARQGFAADNRRIYASFESSGYNEKNVMVKWSRVDSPEVLVYDKYPVNTGKGHNYVWLERPNDWESGYYQVEIFSLADNLSLMARGDYEVE